MKRILVLIALLTLAVSVAALELEKNSPLARRMLVAMLNTNFEERGVDTRAAVDTADNRTLVLRATSFHASCTELAKDLREVKDGALKQVGFLRIRLERSGSGSSVCPL